MTIPAEFDDIRPFTPEEIPAAIDALIDDPEFHPVLQGFYKDIPLEALRMNGRACKDNLEFQKVFFYPLVHDLFRRCTAGCDFDTSALPDHSTAYTFVSNHRDIVLDSAFLCVMLIDGGFSTTVEIAIGDNLLIRPWIKTLVRLNKSFIVKRSAGLRETLVASRLMSRYMHFAIAEKHENVWIAQREGRAKDSDDRTQESVLKMMALGGEGSVIDRLKNLNIVPLTISYEYDPCDYLKAKEFQMKRDDASFKKSQADDLANMQTGIFGYKGAVHYQAATPINTWIDELRTAPKGEVFTAIATRIDREIHRGYRLFTNNYIAADLLSGKADFPAHYTAEDRVRFEEYIASRLALIDLPYRDDAFLRERLLTMYANPLLNYLKAQA